MSNALNVVPSEDKVSTGVRDTESIAEGVANVLADTYRLVFKTHAYHWNVEGPLFYSVHNVTEGQYEDMFKAADELAERIRALGHLYHHTRHFFGVLGVVLKALVHVAVIAAFLRRYPFRNCGHQSGELANT